jgi:hypothetical protein
VVFFVLGVNLYALSRQIPVPFLGALGLAALLYGFLRAKWMDGYRAALERGRLVAHSTAAEIAAWQRRFFCARDGVFFEVARGHPRLETSGRSGSEARS